MGPRGRPAGCRLYPQSPWGLLPPVPNGDSGSCPPVRSLDYNAGALTDAARLDSSPALTGALARSTVIAALGGLLFGFDTAVTIAADGEAGR